MNITKYRKSRHTVVCRAPQEAGTQHREYIDREKKQFSHIHSSVLLLQNKTIFAVNTPINISTPHFTFQQNHFKHSRDMTLQKLA